MNEVDYSTLKGRRRRAWNRTSGRCGYCGAELTPDALTVDHIVSRATGGGDDEPNLMACCRPCNSIKGKKSVEDFRYWMQCLKNGVPVFSKAQRAYLRSHGIEMPEVPTYAFYFEANEL